MNEKINIQDVLYKYQFRLKLGIKPLLLSKTSFVGLVICYIFFDGMSFFLNYGVVMLLHYRFFYSLNRDGGQCNIFGYLVLAALCNKIREKRRKKK